LFCLHRVPDEVTCWQLVQNVITVCTLVASSGAIEYVTYLESSLLVQWMCFICLVSDGEWLIWLM